MVLAALLITDVAMAIEKAPYTVLEKEDDFELRQYPAYIVAETFVEGDFEKVGNEGFRRLAAYINGKNRMNTSIPMTAPVNQEPRFEKIAMTAPVSQEKEGDKWRITFVMPSKYSLQTLPEPLDSRVTLTREPARLVTAIRYSGTWRKDRYMLNESRLMEIIRQRHLKPIGKPVWARYDPPFMPWFLRRNEVLIEVER
jgi:hypothetical protein